MDPDDHGTIAVEGGEIAYYRFGTGRGTPLLVIHGGPGAGHRYLRRLAALADEREIVFYDQLGSGNSVAVSDDLSLWTLERFVSEIDAVRRALDLEHVHLFGHSAGGWFAIEYLLQTATGVRSATLANTAASMPAFQCAINGLIAELPRGAQRAIVDHAKDVWSTDEDYLEAVSEFYGRHVVRDATQGRKLLEAQAASAAYTAMIGPHELAIVGNMRSWDREADLADLTTPTLVISGGHDHNTPACARRLADGIADSVYVRLDDCGHDPLNQATETVLSLLRTFMSRHEGARGV